MPSAPYSSHPRYTLRPYYTHLSKPQSSSHDTHVRPSFIHPQPQTQTPMLHLSTHVKHSPPRPHTFHPLRPPTPHPRPSCSHPSVHSMLIIRVHSHRRIISRRPQPLIHSTPIVHPNHPLAKVNTSQQANPLASTAIHPHPSPPTLSLPARTTEQQQ